MTSLDNTTQNAVAINSKLNAGVDYALLTIKIETEALVDLQQQILLQQNVLQKAITLIITAINNGGHAVITGMGKSGHIARKISATMASTGTPSLFMHPAEAVHGDLGMVGKHDVVIGLSYSGESKEVVELLPALKRMGTPLIAICGMAKSSLSRVADASLIIPVKKEACPHNLAPTSSTTAQLALGDALALGVLVAQGFSADDFAQFHPGGSLGKRLLKVADIMHINQDIPKVAATATIADALTEMTRGRLGTTVIVDDVAANHSHIKGMFTDGDLRRTMLSGQLDIKGSISTIMNTNPYCIQSHVLTAKAVAIMEENRINQLLVVDGNKRLMGIINMHDLLEHRVV